MLNDTNVWLDQALTTLKETFDSQVWMEMQGGAVWRRVWHRGDLICMFFVGVFLDLPMRASMAIYASFLPSRSKATTQPQILKLKKKKETDSFFPSLIRGCTFLCRSGTLLWSVILQIQIILINSNFTSQTGWKMNDIIIIMYFYLQNLNTIKILNK